ncbi:TonB-dependent receptor [Pseudolysobacter antarcticus]|uniref:TonB-dependent receptor n=1 Tax=Pseudolysobacter antarcticus TaxID=2511995 RepID=A0A411HFY6_9GAMM|nr:TonB-dependent receptor [Pseudolysobacter antarcticus]QBB69413.1 TonB-dependent receptor [Pseudolysobacter antarcticus]
MLVLYGSANGASAQTAIAQPDGEDNTAATTAAADPQSAGSPGANSSATKDKTTQLSDVVVTYRGSLEKAIDLKRDSVGMVDAIMAEDIGKFPDLNLAESLQRIPGISISRVAGEGRQISVDGLGPNFTQVRINGMDSLATTGADDNNGGNNRTRAFDFNVFSADLFNKIEVHKSASADIAEGALGATVDLHTPHPFDFNKFVFSSSVQGGENIQADKVNSRATALIGDVFDDGKMGLLFSAAYTHRNVTEAGSGSVRWDNGPSSGGFAAASPFKDALLPTTFIPRLPRYNVYTHDQDRVGLTGSYQWQITDSTLLTVDGLYADFKEKRREYDLEAVSFSRSGTGKPQTIVKDGVVAPNGNLVYGVFDNVDMRVEGRYDQLETQFGQTTLNLDQKFGDNFKLDLMIGHSRSDYTNPYQTTVTLDHANANNFSYDYRNNPNLPAINYGFDVGNPANWSFANGQSELRLRPNTTSNLELAKQIDLTWDITEHLHLKGGLNDKDYKFQTSEMRRASEVSVPNLPTGTSLADLTQLMDFGGKLGAPGGTPNGWVVPNIDAFAKLFNIYGNQGTFSLSPASNGANGNNRSVKETDRGGYVQASFDTTVFGMPLRGDAGVRRVDTDQFSTGFAIINGGLVQTSVSRSYSDTLPSMNLALSLADDWLLRFGAAKVLTRPDLGNLSPGVNVSVSGGSRVVSGGNPYLDPYRAKTYDLGLEWYFATGSYLSGALFRKDIDSFEQVSHTTQPFSASGLPVSLIAGTAALPTDDFDFTIPVNTPGGKLNGIELGYQQSFTFLPGFWKDFGTIINYTHVTSKIQYVTSTGANSLLTDLTGLSKNAYNGTLFYDNGTYSARVSVAHRDGYLTTVPGRNNNDVEGTKGTTNVDFMTSWKYNQNLEFSFEGINLTNTPNNLYVSSTGERSVVYTRTGREYYVGVRLRF